MGLGSVQLSPWFWVRVVVGVFVVGLVGSSIFIVSRVGIKESGYVISSVFKEVVHHDGSLTKFQKKVDTDGKKEFPEDTYQIQGFLLMTDYNLYLWLLTLYGIQHFTPIPDRKITFYTMDECFNLMNSRGISKNFNCV